MKSIIYLSDYGDRPCRPVLVNHDPGFPAYEHYMHHDLRYTGKYYLLRYVCTVSESMGIHEKINLRAEHIARTASIRIYHGRACPSHWKDKRNVGRDYQWYCTPQRIARSRFRNCKRNRDRGISSWNLHGYACIDWSFGLTRPHDRLTTAERHAIHQRLIEASTSREKLTPWSLNDATEKTAARSVA